MIAKLAGTIAEKTDQSLIVMVGGVGYEVMVAPVLLADAREGLAVELYTYLSIRENAQELFGFPTRSELDFFKRLLTISGIGPKTALHILSLGPVGELAAAVMRGDLGYLTKVSGIGKKTAERIIVELKGKLAEFVGGARTGQTAGSTDTLASLMEALEQLGYTTEEARKAASRAIEQKPEGTLEEQLKIALQSISA